MIYLESLGQDVVMVGEMGGAREARSYQVGSEIGLEQFFHRASVPFLVRETILCVCFRTYCRCTGVF